MKTLRLSRPCYDKYHRCPGWAGGGWKFAKRTRCDDGRIRIPIDARLADWRFWRCDTCNVIVLPYHAKKLMPSYVWYVLRTRISTFVYDPKAELRYMWVDLRWHLWRKRKWKKKHFNTEV